MKDVVFFITKFLTNIIKYNSINYLLSCVNSTKDYLVQSLIFIILGYLLKINFQNLYWDKILIFIYFIGNR